MKRIISAVSILVVVLCGYMEVEAQFTPTTYRVGATANLPYLTANLDTFDARTGFGIWGNTEFEVGEFIRFTPGLAYNNFGYNQNYFNDSGSRQRRKITEHYFDVIAELNYLPSPRQNSTRINFGMGVSFLAARNTDQPDILGGNITQRTLDNKKPFTPNFIVHAGINAPLGKSVDLGVQYTLSLPHRVFPRDISGRLGTFQIRLGFKIAPSVFDKREFKKDIEVQSKSLYNKDSLIVVVRLRENSKRIETLKNLGLTGEANEEMRKTLEQNIEIVEAFKEKFTLLPVYYFYDSDSKKILEEGFTGSLLNERLERDSSFVLPQKEFVIAEFGRQFNEVTQTSGMYGLVILDENFQNIPDPFPAFTSNAYGILSKSDVIGKFQKRLYQYLLQ